MSFYNSVVENRLRELAKGGSLVAKQELLIQQKKREIEEKLKSKASAQAAQSTVGLKNERPKPLPLERKPASAPLPLGGSSALNTFRNDGSFLDQFRKLQGDTAKPSAVPSSSPPASLSSPSLPSSSPSAPPSVPIGTNLNKTSAPQESKPASSNVGLCIKLQTPTQPKALQPSAVASELDEDEVQLQEVSSPDGKAVQGAIERVAICVAINGGSAEEAARISHADDPAYRFLTDKDGEDYQRYRERVCALTAAKHRAEESGALPSASRLDSGNKNRGNSSNASSADEGTRKRKRQSRWGPQEAQVAPPITLSLGPAAVQLPPFVQSDPGLIAYARQVFNSIDLSFEQWKQLEDQRKMRALFEMMQAKKKADEARAMAGKFKYEYDSDEETEGGTWEHKKRAEEMEKTRAWADELTSQAKGKHHIGDFLPPDELEKFMEKYDALKDGRNPDLSDYREHKITEDNVGYQMLQKLGWTEGQGLGANGSGITAPVNKAIAPVENAGLGIDRPQEVSAHDDEYEAYRKRMMLAYRFRPNPLNNPRRPYY
ncbi:SURP and G-patch domain-containing protein 1-like [Ornithodoros turicata]